MGHTCFVFGQTYPRGRVDLWLGGGYAESGACVRIAGPEAEVARQQPNRERL